MRKLAKSKMNLKYKTQKRERNKKVETTKKDSVLTIFKNFFGILLFLGISYLCILGMQKLGLFEKGYTAPTAKEVTTCTQYSQCRQSGAQYAAHYPTHRSQPSDGDGTQYV